MEKATWGDGCALFDHKIKARRVWEGVPSVSWGCLRGPEGCVCVEPRSGSTLRREGLKWAPDSWLRPGIGKRTFVNSPLCLPDFTVSPTYEGGVTSL